MVHISTSHPQGVYYYMLFYLAAIIIGLAGAAVVARKNKFNLREFAVIVSVGILGLLIGSKLFMFDSSQWTFLFNEGHLPVQNGKSALGAILGAMIGFWLAGKLLGQKESILDLFAVSMPMALAVQGFGCLMAGCCHGSLTSVPWGITYGPETRPFIEQQQIGMIQPDALASLAIHPSQIYAVIICILISVIVWKTRNMWKSPSANFIFSIILYLSYRVMEEILGLTIAPEGILGMSLLVWKILLLVIFLTVLMYQERKYGNLQPDAKDIRKTDTLYDLKVLTIPLVILVITLSIGNWPTSEERVVVLLTIFPLSGVIILEKLLQLFLSVRYAKVSWMILFAFVLMGQKADNPGGYPKSYTAVDLSTAFGNFNMNHLFNERYSGDCENGEWTGENVEYNHQYATGGLGVIRKINYNEWQSILLSLNMYAGKEKEDPVNNTNTSMTPLPYDNNIWSISPKIQYDAKDVGFGLGCSFGKVAYDRDDADNHSDYNPQYDGRKFIMQARLRLGSEDNLFVEGLGGYDADGVGEYTWQALGGSRFNTQKYMLKTGIAFRKKRSLGFIISGEMLLADRLLLCPELIYYTNSGNPGGGYRTVIGLEYRLPDKVK